MISESGALVEFYTGSTQNKAKSAEAGRPIFVDRLFVRIQTPGDTRTTIDRIATEQDKRRFPRALSIHERGEKVAMEGTPLEEWPPITRSQVNELKHVGIMSVEVLADVSDTHIQRMGPGYLQLREKAKAFIESADAEAAATAWAREKAELQEQMRQMQEQMQAMQESAKRKPAAKKTETQAELEA